MTFLFIYGGLIALLMLSLLAVTFIIKFDKEHNASYNSWHYKLYCYLTFDDKAYPGNICLYYWKYVLHILLLIFTCPIIIYGIFWPKQRKPRNLWWTTIIFWVELFFIMIIGGTLIQDFNLYIFNIYILDIFLIGTIFWIGMLLAAGLILFSIWGISELIKHYKSKRLTTLYKEKETSLIILRFKSWKDKNCPIINWK